MKTSFVTQVESNQAARSICSQKQPNVGFNPDKHWLCGIITSLVSLKRNKMDYRSRQWIQEYWQQRAEKERRRCRHVCLSTTWDPRPVSQAALPPGSPRGAWRGRPWLQLDSGYRRPCVYSAGWVPQENKRDEKNVYLYWRPDWGPPCPVCTRTQTDRKRKLIPQSPHASSRGEKTTSIRTRIAACQRGRASTLAVPDIKTRPARINS